MGWNRVKDELPRKDEVVAVYSYKDGISLGMLNSDNRWIVQYPWDNYDDPIYWMELPACWAPIPE